MSLPCVAIVGRPNVGKSTLFNALCGRRIAIVEATPGITRDRLSSVVRHSGASFELVDTGGIGVEDADGLTAHVQRQIDQALERADLLVMVVDTRAGLLPDDRAIATRLRGLQKPVLLVANKADGPAAEPAAAEFAALGLGPPLPVSATHSRGLGRLLDAVVAALPAGLLGRAPDVMMKLAIVGRRNVGKSSLVNAIAGEERVIVSELPGTTRDAVDVQFEKDGKTFVVIDTAGIHKQRRQRASVEFYGLVRARESIARADVVFLMLDVASDIVEVDKRLAREIGDRLKPCVIVVNKWDLAKGKISTQQYADYLEKTLPVLSYAPITFTTARSGRRVWPTIELAQQLFKQAHHRATTAEVNRALHEAVRLKSPGRQQGAQARFYYATQVGVAPPTLVVFVNRPELVGAVYRRYLANALRERLPFPEVPIRLDLRARTRRGGE
ncbi:MAG TPA: ribosome biogenesis GTPase Der [Planctomycetota bacterium]|nr:ribosome biogenesis GTPase Der [Planctomycetota bacterium]HRR81671.1 ribosome biogenesis GTPase Der [Planctomycetota bacterium]